MKQISDFSADVFKTYVYYSTCNVDTVQASVKSVLPSVSDDILNNLTKKLDGDGIESLATFCFPTKSDLVGVLKPIQIRKLLAQWKISDHIITLVSRHTTLIYNV